MISVIDDGEATVADPSLDGKRSFSRRCGAVHSLLADKQDMSIDDLLLLILTDEITRRDRRAHPDYLS